MKFSKKILLSALAIGIIAIAPINAEPGDKDDPIIVLSYLNQRFDELVGNYNLDKIAEQEQAIIDLNTQIVELTNQLSTQTTIGSTLEIVTLLAGETLTAGAGTEIILRSGIATAVASAQGGLSDVTGGADIPQGQYILTNHLLIVARDDGRGVYAQEDAILMVRGAYTVSSNSLTE